MKIGLRTPSIKKSVKARTTGKIKRTVKKSINPLYGKKGVGFVKDPVRSVKNSIYHRTTFGLSDVLSSNSNNSGNNYTTYSESNAYEYTVLPFFDIPIVAKHFDCMDKVVENYNKVTNSKDYFGKHANIVIKNGIEDISIAADFIECCKNNNELIPTYPSFRILALLYEHQKEYQKAIEVCKQAIKLGFTDDGTKGTMTKRVERLEKLLTHLTDVTNAENNTEN